MEFKKMSHAAVERLSSDTHLHVNSGMSVPYKLMYFDTKGFGEPIRFVLSYLEKDFEDVRLSPLEWEPLKKCVPFGQLPVLKMGDETLHQSVAIVRYLAKDSNLSGVNNWENLQIDMVIETLMDLYRELLPACSEQPLNENAVLRLKNDVIPYYMSKFNKIVEDNDGYLANKRLSWADLYFVAFVESLEDTLNAQFHLNYPNLKLLWRKVLGIPKIKKWIEKRPKPKAAKSNELQTD